MAESRGMINVNVIKPAISYPSKEFGTFLKM